MAHSGRALAGLVLAAMAAIAAAQAFRENVKVGLVSIRLDVRGRDGNLVADLKASELKLRVDGKDVAIEGLDRVGSPAAGAPAPETPPAGTPAPASAPVPADASTSASAAASSSDIYFAILFDETSSNTYDRRDVFRQLESFLKSKTGAGVHVLVERFNGSLHPEGTWTTDAPTAVANL